MGVSREEWAARVAAIEDAPRVRKEPITVGRILDASLRLVEADGFDALTMRRVAAALGTGAGSLYAHVRNKAELDDLLIAELCRKVTVPEPDPASWRAQIMDICRELRDQFLRYPGISRAALVAAPDSLDALRVSEGMLAILLAAGISPKSAAWAIDAAFLYISAYCYEAAVHQRPDAEEIVVRYAMLPKDRFPNTVAQAREITSGEGHDRFDFTLDLLLRGLGTQR